MSFSGEEVCVDELKVKGHNFSRQVKEFRTLFVEGDMQKLITKALSGGLSECSLRGVCWRVFLAVLDPRLPISIKTNDNDDDDDDTKNSTASKTSVSSNDKKKATFQDWSERLTLSRKQYDVLIEKHCVDPREKEKEVGDPTICNPLAQDESNPWSQYFNNSELEKLIQQDLLRLYPEHAFFSSQSIAKLMQRILFIWSRENSDISYRQGMHELLAPIFLVLFREKKSKEECKLELDNADNEIQRIICEELCNILNDEYLEHDCYCLFTHLMKKMKDFFQITEKPSNLPKIKATQIPLPSDQSSKDDPIVKTPIYNICHKIQSNILKKMDRDLHNHLESLGIEPQLYGLRWIRLLFGREFNMEDTLTIWDAIFADSGVFKGYDDPESLHIYFDLGLVEHIALMLLIYIRTNLLERDYSGCLKRLMKYPPVENISTFIQKALEARSNPHATVSSILGQQSNHQTVIDANLDHPLSGISSADSSINSITVGYNATAKQQVSTPYKTKDKAKKQEQTSSKSASSTPKSKPKPLPNIYQSTASIGKKISNKFAGTSFSGSENNGDKSKIEEMIKKEIDLSNTMEKIINALQNQIFRENNHEPLDESIIAMGIAELKLIKDVLRFQLPFEERDFTWIKEIEKKESDNKEKQNTTESN